MNRRQQAETDSAGFAGNNARILARRVSQHSHAEGGDGVLAGDKLRGAVAQHFPAQRVGLTAGKAGHNGRHIAADVDHLALQRRAVETVGQLRLDDNGMEMLCAVDVGQIAQHAAGHRAHAALQEHVRRAGDTH